MTDCQPLGSDNLETSSIGADEGHDPGVDEHDSDADTIRMSSPEFWHRVNVENLPVIPNSLILTESTPDSTYANYPGCQRFDCTHIFQRPETTCVQLAKGKIETNGVESGSKRSHQFCGSGSKFMEYPLLSYEQFKSLGGSDQEEYFNSMARASCTWKAFENSCPRIDKIVFQHYEANNRLTLAEQEAAYSLQEHIKQRWRLSRIPLPEPEARHAPRNMAEQARWYDDDLRWNSVNFQFEFEHTQGPQSNHQSLDDFERSIRQCGFYKHLSSPLLLYRLNILAGEFKEVTSDNYKNSWDITFHHADSVSTLRLWDSKGRARAVFSGLKEAEGDALEFINFVTRFKFPHTYDGVISGTVA